MLEETMVVSGPGGIDTDFIRVVSPTERDVPTGDPITTTMREVLRESRKRRLLQKRDRWERLGAALVASISLLGPRLIMDFNPALLKSIITVCAWVTYVISERRISASAALVRVVYTSSRSINSGIKPGISS